MEPFLGQIALFGFGFTINGWAPCNGQILSIAQNSALFALLGTQYGGDGRSTFALPKLDAPAEGMSYQIAVQGIFPSRA